MKGRRIYSSVLANGLSRVGIGLLNIVVVPIYMTYLGMEAYGLVGFYSVVQGLLVVFDFGISAALTRSLSKNSVDPANAAESQSLAKTLELVYWAISCFIGLALALAAPLLAAHWIKRAELSLSSVTLALVSIGIAILFQFPVSFYTAGLVGLQRQVEQSVLNLAIWIVRAVGVIPIMLIFTDRLNAFFIWQALINAAAAVFIRYVFWRSMPRSSKVGKHDLSLMKHVGKFAISVSLVTTSLLVFNNLDKLFLSGRLALSDYGFYVAAWQIASVLYLFYVPVYTAFYPVLVQFHTSDNREGFIWALSRSSLITSCLIVPTVSVIFFYAPNILYVWTHRIDVAQMASPYLRSFMPGALAGGVFYVAWAVAQAQDRVSQLVKYAVAGVVVFLALMPFVFRYYGSLGVAIAWSVVSFILNLTMCVLALLGTLKNLLWRWLYSTLLLPVVICSTFCWLAQHYISLPDSNFLLILGLLALWLTLVGTTYLSSSLRKNPGSAGSSYA